MVREVLERDAEGREAVIVYRESESEKAERAAEIDEQAERGREVARSMSKVPEEAGSSAAR
jgi:hypothetical protein